MAGMFSMRRCVRERSERCSHTRRLVSGLLPKISPLVGRSGDSDSSGGVTCRRWAVGKVAGVVSHAMQVFLAIFQRNLPFFEQIQVLGFDTIDN